MDCFLRDWYDAFCSIIGRTVGRSLRLMYPVQTLRFLDALFENEIEASTSYSPTVQYVYNRSETLRKFYNLNF